MYCPIFPWCSVMLARALLTFHFSFTYSLHSKEQHCPSGFILPKAPQKGYLPSPVEIPALNLVIVLLWDIHFGGKVTLEAWMTIISRNTMHHHLHGCGDHGQRPSGGLDELLRFPINQITVYCGPGLPQAIPTQKPSAGRQRLFPYPTVPQLRSLKKGCPITVRCNSAWFSRSSCWRATLPSQVDHVTHSSMSNDFSDCRPK